MKRLKLFFVLSFVVSDLALGANVNPETFFKNLSSSTMNLVDEFYEPSAILRDPVGELKGSDKIKAYYKHQYSAVTSIRWTTENLFVKGSETVMFWTMHLATPNLNGGKEFSVPGVSRFVFSPNGKVQRHEDFFDMGAFVYEKVPVLRNVIGYIKNQLSKGSH
jgi:hypothetical protein